MDFWIKFTSELCTTLVGKILLELLQCLRNEGKDISFKTFDSGLWTIFVLEYIKKFLNTFLCFGPG